MFYCYLEICEIEKVDQPGIGGLDIKEAEYLSRFGPGESTISFKINTISS